MNQLSLCDKWHQREVARTLDSDSEVALLFRRKTGLCNWLDLAVDVDVALECLDVFVVKVHWCIFLESFHDLFSLKWNLAEVDWFVIDILNYDIL